MRTAAPQPLTADEARAAAAAEGLELVPSARSKAGFMGVSKHGGKYVAKITENLASRAASATSRRRKREPSCVQLFYARHVNTL